MHSSEGGWALSYHGQISADAAQGLMAGVAVTQEANDTGPLLPALQRIAERLQRKPEQRVAEAGYSTGAAIEERAERQVGFLGSMPRAEASTGRTAPQRLPPSAFIFQPETNRQGCPEGQYGRQEGCWQKERGLVSGRYLAQGEDGLSCARKPECCRENRGGRGILRGEESAGVLALRQKMETEEARRSYRRRGRVVEFCHAWSQSKLGQRQFPVRGLVKVQREMLWVCLSYNLPQWMGLRKPLPTAAPG
jgi:hypothetical protein